MPSGHPTPAISVLMPVYNGEKFLSEAIESIISQSFKNFEFIIVNDGSTDSTHEILNIYSKLDSRIIVVSNCCNLGISAALNVGMSLSRASLIARMDADDIAVNHRLEIQYYFMVNNPDVDVCGGYVSIINSSDVWTVPVCNMSIRSRFLFWNSLYHPTVMFKKSSVVALVHGYDEDMSGVEDYALWVSLAENENISFANIPEVLVNYRFVSKDAKEKKDKKLKKIKMLQHLYARQLCVLGVDASTKNIQQHWRCVHGQVNVTKGQFQKNSSWLMQLLAANLKSKKYSMDCFASEIVHWHQRFRISSLYKVCLCLIYRFFRHFRNTFRFHRFPIR